MKDSPRIDMTSDLLRVRIRPTPVPELATSSEAVGGGTTKDGTIPGKYWSVSWRFVKLFGYWFHC